MSVGIVGRFDYVSYRHLCALGYSRLVRRDKKTTVYARAYYAHALIESIYPNASFALRSSAFA